MSTRTDVPAFRYTFCPNCGKPLDYIVVSGPDDPRVKRGTCWYDNDTNEVRYYDRLVYEERTQWWLCAHCDTPIVARCLTCAGTGEIAKLNKVRGDTAYFDTTTCQDCDGNGLLWSEAEMHHE